MNTRHLIESGQIELYVAGAMPEDEKRLIEELAVTYPEILNEIKEAEDRWSYFAGAYSRNPRPKVRKTIVDLTLKEGARIYNKNDYDISDEEKSSDIKWWITAMAIGLLIMVSALNVMFYLKWTEAEDKLMNVHQQELNNNSDSVTDTFIPLQ